MGRRAEGGVPLACLAPEYRPFDRRLLERGATRAARELLGAYLLRATPRGWIGGEIVETEAYLAAGDPGSHSRSGETRRNASMFSRAGHAYVYRIYGLHHCANVVTGAAGRGEAVLVRALAPRFGYEFMARARGTDDPRAWCSGPAKLVRALGIGPEHDRVDLLADGELALVRARRATRPGAHELVQDRRVGLGAGEELALRFRRVLLP